MDGVALITGAASGIGFAASRAFLAKGSKRVVMTDLSDKLTAQRDVLAKEFPNADILAVPCNVADEAAVVSLFKTAVDKFGRIDYAANCAGIASGAPFSQLSLDQYKKVTSVNENGVFLCMREEVAQMLKQDYAPAKDGRRKQRGAIVSISSLCGFRAIPGSANYIAAKHAVVGLTKSAALEVSAQGVRCNAIAPGWIDTPMTNVLPETKAILAWGTQPDRTPMARSGLPEEIADVIVFLCSEEASFVTGSTWTVDGGYAVY